MTGQSLGPLILEIFRLNGELLAAGDALVAEVGLSSARWQVLGAIAMASRPEPVATLARSMGLTRQAVQRVVNDLLDEGLVALEPNPNHKRAHCVVMTFRGGQTYASANHRRDPWLEDLASGMDEQQILQALSVLRQLRQKLQAA